MPNVRLTNLADHLRAAGLQVVETRGWKARGAALPGMPNTILAHHTATPAKAGIGKDIPTLQLLIDGRSDLPGPLCQVGLSRSGVVYMVASGKANHAGKGEWKGQTSSAATIGIEAEHPGVGAYPREQYAAYIALCAALCTYLNVGPERVAGHKDWALPRGRKTDPNFDMNTFRREVGAKLAGKAPSTTPQGDDVMTPAQEKKVDELLDMIKALVRPRQADKSDVDPSKISLADVITKIETK